MEPFETLVRANEAYVAGGRHASHPVRPSRRMVVVTCMDSRIDVFASLGLGLGESHVIRVAGARITPDVLRSLALSTHALGTRAVAVIGHTDCGLQDPDGSLVARLTEAMGHAPQEREWFAFSDVGAAVAEDCAALRGWVDAPRDLAVGGYVLDVATGRLNEVAPPTPSERAPS